MECRKRFTKYFMNRFSFVVYYFFHFVIQIIHKFRDEEMEHHDIGKEQDGEKVLTPCKYFDLSLTYPMNLFNIVRSKR